ncbi:hypothetical protein [Kroppenstedtia sanguinis]|uniref:Transposase n=1 Tax=Kroppenstedtia sanguinis TaxID=1380684 RepID=A0ABW4CA33_9BACL
MINQKMSGGRKSCAAKATFVPQALQSELKVVPRALQSELKVVPRALQSRWAETLE